MPPSEGLIGAEYARPKKGRKAITVSFVTTTSYSDVNCLNRPLWGVTVSALKMKFFVSRSCFVVNSVFSCAWTKPTAARSATRKIYFFIRIFFDCCRMKLTMIIFSLSLWQNWILYHGRFTCLVIHCQRRRKYASIF